ncbi:NAD-dependent epimerase/dehydratase family protein [Enterococcus sp. 5H]|uniref:NAD-dependent epimerase/dehydratase family protein n=1 Tax=Enterococcus sp. 5H TaxID=1229490 RepID=UPI0023040BA8|nr:NAD-dependent epimerase/dehydratase family protein [Enterococcus sp. 5H]MDA9471966.1 Dihydroflavonol-4-reductase [Enterococcus sp. 5H]
MKKTLYLVTGAAGFLGNNVVHQLVKSGQQVKALVLKNDPAAKYIPAEAEIFFGDITDLNSMNKYFAESEDTELIVIHCASLVTTSPEKNKIVYDVNVNGTKNVVDLCIQKKVKKLVYVSSTGAILEAPHGEKIVEPLTFFPNQVIGYYGETKAIATQYVFDSVKKSDLDATVIYPSGIAGPNDSAFGPFSSFIIRYCKGEMPVGVAGTFNSVDVRDLATATIEAASRGRKGEGYIISNELVDMRQMFDLISEKSGVNKVKIILTPEEMLEISSVNLAKEQVETDKEVLKFELYNLTRNNLFSHEKASKELDFASRPFEETIQDTVDWLKEENRI